MKISCVIPVYNEAARVEKVLAAVAGHELIDEIIIINDGSTDNSEAILKNLVKKGGRFWAVSAGMSSGMGRGASAGVGFGGSAGASPGMRLISYQKNKGKSCAVKIGIKEAKNEWIMTIDSDLVGLKSEDITALIVPVASGAADVSMTLRKNSSLEFKLFGLDFVSGERVFNKSLIEDLELLDKLPCFGLEVFLNERILKKKMRIKVVKWKNVITPRKSVKFGFWAGVKGDYKMVMEIISLIGVRGIVRQFLGMRKLRV